MITNETKTTSPAPAGNPAAATETASLSLKDALSKKLGFADAASLSLPKLVEWAKETSKWNNSVKEKAKEFRGQAKYIGIYYAALKVKYCEAQDAGYYDKGTPFDDFVKSQTGNGPETHAQSCSMAFLRLVRTGLMTEAQYLTPPADWLETANRILTAVVKQGGDFAADEHGIALDPTVKAVVEILTLKTATVDTAAKLLRELRNKQTGKAVVEAGELNADKAIALVDDIAAAGFLGLLLSHLPDAVKTRPETERRELFQAWYGSLEARLADSFADAATIAKWDDEVAAAKKAAEELAAGPKLITSATPAETPDSEPPAIDAGELAAAMTAGQIPAAA